jgi:hypothetical protein
MRTCPHPGCHREIAPDRFACKRHWYQLPIAMREKIWTDYVGGTTDLSAALAYWESSTR